MYFRAFHAVADVYGFADVLFFDAVVEAGPAGSRVEFFLAGKEWSVAASAEVDAFVLVVPIQVAKRRFGALLAHDSKLVGFQYFFPFGVGFFECRAGVSFRVRGQSAGIGADFVFGVVVLFVCVVGVGHDCEENSS